MCRWSCPDVNSTFMCKWCGTRYCRECLRGEFTGLMREPTICAKCNQKRCQGQKVEAVSKEFLKNDQNSGKKGSSRGGSANSKRGKSAGGKSKNSSTSSGKKGGKKKKKK